MSKKYYCNKSELMEIYPDEKIVEKALNNNLITQRMYKGQVREILLGLRNNTVNQVRIYADSDYSANLMRVARILIEARVSSKKIRRTLEGEGFNFRQFFFYIMAGFVSDDDALTRRFILKCDREVRYIYEKFLPMVKKYGLTQIIVYEFDMQYYCAKIKWLIDNPEKSI